MKVALLDEQYLEFLSLKVGCIGSSKSTLVKIPHCWKSHVTAQICNHCAPKSCVVVDRDGGLSPKAR